MRIAAVIGVKDEAALILPCIERLRAVGVGPIVVLDDGSTDGTAEIVDRFVVDPERRLTRQSLEVAGGPTLDRTGPVLGPLIERHAPDWILFTDADEFWLSADGGLDDTLREATTDALTVERFNVPLTDVPFVPGNGAGEAAFLDVPIIVRRMTLNSSVMRQSERQRWIMHAVMPRIICRAERIGSFTTGGHSVTATDGTTIDPAPARTIVIVHLPLTTIDRFARKVDNARAFLARWADRYPGEAAWHWKRWVEMADAGRLQEEFRREAMSATELSELRASGVVDTARSLLAAERREPPS